ncbi:unnamed protein product [Ceratitis capitata]|uniref:(Mediterranean fruit fly) hypothetical protein n=1 Tax=Ceratitis capitata TaxID=7213 RepID=A0A811VBC5_CERCA|nr:unnamed protein product [Ceratitis capitata]
MKPIVSFGLYMTYKSLSKTVQRSCVKNKTNTVAYGSIAGESSNNSADRCPLDTLRIVLIEIESILNSSPLTDVSLSSDEIDSITPNHFLIGCPNSPHPVDRKMLKETVAYSPKSKEPHLETMDTTLLPTITFASKVAA